MGSEPQAPVVSAEERQRLIRKAAYQHCLRRGGIDGQGVHDWLAAEAEVDAMLGRSSEVERLARDAS
jgi:hypothetical protein